MISDCKRSLVYATQLTPFTLRQCTVNRYTGPGILSFVAYEDVQVHVHASNEVPNDIESDIKEEIFYGSDKEIIIKVIDMVNDASVQESSISKRNCRFPWERNEATQLYPMLYNQYSHSTCIIECSLKIQLELCNCSHHLMPYSNNDTKMCDIDGLICLTNNFGKIDSMKKDCSCDTSCDEPDYNALYSSATEKYRNEPGSLITIAMLGLPKERFIRRVVKTTMDDFISIGSILSLFFGLSILSTLDYTLRAVKYLFRLIMFIFSIKKCNHRRRNKTLAHRLASK
ncbi:sodium channel protein Nach-like [Sitodiplosis mosellana]|uniref:sodium channel protein Nach-like n=1 Tax=Sitodiplosis mosellana TaxID=263140 RepID=UPI0024442385|nr:sodium channel protein Nach-like [Sitodiplosis mosellana]